MTRRGGIMLSFRRPFILLLIVLFAIPCISPALAGTTGALSGVVVELDNGAPVAGAAITAVSPSGTVSAASDAGGHFSFVSLAPDEYTLSVAKDGFDSTTFPG